MKKYDVIIIGAGAGGLMAATQLKQRKKSVLILDIGDTPARKIAISGGGNCNFTNTHADYTHYFGKNPHFVTSALNQFSPINTLNWAKSHGIKYIEKSPGRYFCKNGAVDIVKSLLMDIGKTPIKYATSVLNITKSDDTFNVETNKGNFLSQSVIIASGGMSYPHLNVSNIGYKIAKNFGHKIEPIRPALCAIKTNSFGKNMAGISLPVEINSMGRKTSDNLLFTHFGIGGPAIYRTTLIDCKKMIIDFAPDIDVFEFLKKSKHINGKRTLANTLSTIIPNKLAHFFTGSNTHNIADYKDSELRIISDKIKSFPIQDGQPIGFQSAEVTFGGISVDKISSKTMESKLCHGLFFVGEVMDITGDLGGYNIQWAFSSGFVAGSNA